MGYHYRARYEFILFFEKGKRRLNDLGTADIITVPRIRGGYPAEKPAEVADVLIRQSSNSGDVVCDPFMGSGSVGIAALRLGRRFPWQRPEPRGCEDCGAASAGVRRRSRAAGGHGGSA
jgi:site-specific DNA-methyltransferase (adenine-specific)